MDSDFEKEDLSQRVAQFQSSDGAISMNADQWWTSIPVSPGVYVVYEDGKVIYCGETASLRARMKDLRDTRNHTLRRSVARHRLTKSEGFAEANQSRKFPLHIELILNEHMSKLMVKAVPISLGRKEIEHELIKLHDPIYNRVSRRGGL